MPAKKGFSMTLVGIYLLKVNNRNTRARGGICSNLTEDTPKQCYCLLLLSLLLILLWTLGRQMPTRIKELEK